MVARGATRGDSRKGKAALVKILKGRSRDQSTVVQHEVSGVHKAECQYAIEVSHLTKRYAGARTNAVDDISFTVRPGEIFGLLGPNGAGKTTTIGTLTTRILPTNGNIRIMGVNAVTDPMGVKRYISILPQLNNLDHSLRFREVLTFHASYHGVPRAEREARADLLLNELGLSQRAQDKVENYSGGMARRLMLARALMHAPDVLFLDEPTSSLDPQSRIFLWERIRTLSEQGVTILLTTHDMDEADLLCERIAIMDKGRILVLNTPSELKKLIPSGACLELHVLLPIDNLSSLHTVVQDSERIRSTLSVLPGVTKVEEIPPTSGLEPEIRLFRLFTESNTNYIADIVHAVTHFGAEVRDIHSVRPSLEDVFIHLTGRNLRS